MTKHHKVTFKSIMHEIGGGVKSIAHPIEHLANKTVSLPEHAIDKFGAIGSEMAIPLVIVGGLVLMAYLKNK
jgi:hypothetical protein